MKPKAAAIAKRTITIGSSVIETIAMLPNAGLQLRRAISIQAEGKKLLEKHAIAPSAARLCYAA